MRQQAPIMNRYSFVEKAQVWIEFVIRRISRRITNAMIKLLQLPAHSEMYKKCFDKFRGTTDLERLEHDLFALSRSFRKHFVNCIRTIRSDVDCHMRLESRRLISLREIVNETLEITACRLSRNEPVSGDDLPGHKIIRT